MSSAGPREIASVRHLLEYEGLRGLCFIVRLLPFHALAVIARWAGRFTYYLDGRGRAVALANLRAAFGDEMDSLRRRRVARASYENFARVMLELLWGPNLTRENFRKYVEIDMRQPPPDQATVYYCLHFGNFEWLSLIGAFVIEPSPVVMQRFRNPSLTRFFRMLRTSTGNEALTQERAMVRLFKFLKGGGKCGVLTDLSLDPKEGAVIIDMFGLKTAVTPFVGAMIRRVPSAVIASEAFPLPDGRWRMLYHEPMYFPSTASLHEVAQKCWDFLEPSVRKHPELWLWSYKCWRFRPSEENGGRYPFYANPAKRFDRTLAGQAE